MNQNLPTKARTIATRTNAPPIKSWREGDKRVAVAISCARLFGLIACFVASVSAHA